MSRPATTTTENGAPAHATTRSYCLDLFTSGLLRNSRPKDTKGQLEKAWGENPSVAVKILLHARDIRGGKGEKACVFESLCWLRKNKPATYKANLERFLEVGCFRDLLELSMRAGLGSEDGKSDKLGGGKDIFELELFASQLKRDLDTLASLRKAAADVEKAAAAETDGAVSPSISRKKKRKLDGNDAKQGASVSLAAKWAPTEKKKYDKGGLKFAKRMAKLMYPENADRRKRYRVSIASLRRHLSIVESQMSSKSWDEIKFGHVPSRAHKLYRKAFKKHSEERYTEYLQNCKTGKAKINSTGLQPHELVRHFMRANGNGDEAIEAQWRALVDDLKSKGKLEHAVAVSDVSGSMNGVPMEVSIALGILVSQLSAEPFRGRLITFESEPQWHKVPVDATLREMVDSVQGMPWGGSTSMHRVFELILDIAVEAKLPQEALPKTLFVFTDLQFDQAAGEGDSQLTILERARQSYAEKGYALPQVVFWNLRATWFQGFPVQKDDEGVAMLSGFSSELLKMFMGAKVLSPEDMMLKAIERYQVEIPEVDMLDMGDSTRPQQQREREQEQEQQPPVKEEEQSDAKTKVNPAEPEEEKNK